MKNTLLIVLVLCVISACHQPEIRYHNSEYQEQFRPQFHYSPAKNWLNDPNGMFYYEGEYHLFYQYHPESTTWGPMHWGHAVSQDLITWKEMPIVLYPDDKGMIFSGSAVVDWRNSSGFGSKENPPIVAMFTYHNQELANKTVITHQSQAIAYSLDKGRSWIKYDKNPVVKNPGIVDFRDPKVMWDDENQQWVMVLAQKNYIGFYTSSNLKEWQHVSNFGENYGAHGGVWECPDLIKLNIEGTDEYAYALLVSINPGGPNGGSATQYFVGDWNGKEFILDSQQADSLKVRGTIFPHGDLIDDFEEGFDNWTISGDAFLQQPTRGSHAGQWPIEGFVGEYLANSFSKGDEPRGELVSAPFEIKQKYINFYVAGGFEPRKVAVQLLIDGKVIMESGGEQTNNFVLRTWPTSDYTGKNAQIKIIDNSSGPWGFIMVDQLTQSDFPSKNAQERALWLDWGTDNYAGVSFANTQDVSPHPIFIGWMNNWDYARTIPTGSWRGAMTLPRHLRLIRSKSGLKVTSLPIITTEKLLSNESKSVIVVGEQKVTELPASGTARIKLDFSPNNQVAFELLFGNENEQLHLDIDLVKGRVLLDRGKSGITDFSQKFTSIIKTPIDEQLTHGTVEIWLDTSSIEIFVGEGKYVITSRIFPTKAYSQLSVINTSINSPISLSINEINAIW